MIINEDNDCRVCVIVCAVREVCVIANMFSLSILMYDILSLSPNDYITLLLKRHIWFARLSPQTSEWYKLIEYATHMFRYENLITISQHLITNINICIAVILECRWKANTKRQSLHKCSSLAICSVNIYWIWRTDLNSFWQIEVRLITVIIRSVNHILRVHNSNFLSFHH